MTPAERLRLVAKTMPVLDQAAAQRQADAQRIQALGQVAEVATKSQVGPGQVQAIQAQVAAAQPQAQLQAAAKSQEQLGQMGQAAIESQAKATQLAQASQGINQEATQANAARATQSKLADADRAQKIQFTKEELATQAALQTRGIEFDANASFLTNKQRLDLSRLGRDVKQELFDKRLQFARDEDGRKFTNERQLMDFNVATAQSEEIARSRHQQLVQAAERAAMIEDRAYTVLIQDAERRFQKAEQEKDQASKSQIAEYIRQLEKKQAKSQSKGAKRATVMGGVATGATVGAVAGGGVASVPGAVIGGVVGGVAALVAVGGPSEVV